MRDIMEELYDKFVPDKLPECYNGEYLMLAMRKWMDTSDGLERSLSPGQSAQLGLLEEQMGRFSRLDSISSFYEGLRLGMKLVLFLL